MNCRVVLVALIFCCAVDAHAQNSPKWEFGLSSSLDVFMDDFKTAYKPGATHILSIGLTDRHKAIRRAWGMNFGYGLYKPKGDTLYLEDGDYDERYYYDQYRTLSVSGWGRWDFLLNEHFELFLGIEAGYNFTSYDYAYLYSGDVNQDHVSDYRIALVPQLGFGIPVNHFCFFAQSRYVFSYGSGVGVDADLNRTLSTGVGVRYRFERPYKKKDPEKPISTKPRITYE